MVSQAGNLNHIDCTHKMKEMSSTKYFTRRNTKKEEICPFFQLSGATLEIFVSWSKKKNSSSAKKIYKKKVYAQTTNQQQAGFHIAAAHRPGRRGWSRSVRPGWRAPPPCRTRPWLWSWCHSGPPRTARWAAPRSPPSGRRWSGPFWTEAGTQTQNATRARERTHPRTCTHDGVCIRCTCFSTNKHSGCEKSDRLESETRKSACIGFDFQTIGWKETYHDGSRKLQNDLLFVRHSDELGTQSLTQSANRQQQLLEYDKTYSAVGPLTKGTN